MASYIQNRKCTKCGHETTAKICPKCKSKTNPSGKWSVRFRTLNIDGSSKQNRLSGYETKSLAEKAYREYMSMYVKPTTTTNNQMTFTELYANFIEYNKYRIKPSSLYCLKNRIELHILPTFNKKAISKISKLDLLNWQHTLDTKKYSCAYKKSLRTIFSSVFNYAVRTLEVLPFNPFERVENFRNTEPKKEMQIWTESEFKQFISFVDNDIYKAFFSFLFLSGCRQGEVLALTYDDINFETGIINVNKSITRKEQGKPYAVTTPKNLSSYRKIKLPNICLEQILQLKATYGEPYVFCGTRPLAETTIARKLIYYCELSKVKKIRIHDFRHSHASLLISKGENILMVAKRLGHSDIEQTLNTYSHLMPNAEEEMINKIDIKI